ncbi:hypothetical protein HMPREF9515_02036 [Enterococcus faecalis TX0860]|nr:hypothetical protein HMPREF9515_02036 [Enterococcus faecalis TX0860]
MIYKGVENIMTDINANDDKEILIAHAKKILQSSIKGSHIAREIGINANQLYDYRAGRRNIETAYLDTLTKFEEFYQKVKDQL